MTTFKRFEDSETWQCARVLCNEIYDASDKPPFSRDFVLRDQIRRAAVSVMSNIAEGMERSGNAELIQYQSIAKGSCGEVRSLLRLAPDRRYIGQEDMARLLELNVRTGGRITNLIKYLKQSDFKGFKFKETQAAYGAGLNLGP
jgi:four helix bundle protein